MAKELPYFKFEPNQWDNGNIQMLSREDKGLFIDLCSMYWSRVGDVPVKLAIQKLCAGNATALNSLCDENIIEVIEGNIFIKFLSEQLNEFADISEQNSKNAKEGWEKRRKQRESSERNATASIPQCENDAIREDKIRLDKKKEEKIIEEKNISLDPFQENFRIDWLKWTSYKKDEFKQSYKKIETEQIAFNNLVKLSKGNENLAREIIEQSIANQWKGLFELKNKGSSPNQTKQSPLGTHRLGDDFSTPI